MNDVTLICGDALEELKKLPDESIDIVITSQPYNCGLKYGTYNDNRDWTEYTEWIKQIFAETFRVMSNGARIYPVVSDSLAFSMKIILEDIGFTFSQILTWCKPNLTKGTKNTGGDWNFMAEHIILCRKGKRIPMLNGASNTHSYFVIPTPQSNYSEGRFHPAQFPIELPDRIISRTPGDVILDPFMGVGSVALAAMKNNRKFIGFDIDPDYVETAKKRVFLAQQQMRMEFE